MADDIKKYLDQYFQQLWQQIQQLRAETAAQFQQMREETAGQFQQVADQFQQMREETAGQFQQMREETAGQFQQLRGEMDQRLDHLHTEVRGAYVLIEDLHGQVRLVAEGVGNLSEKMGRNNKELSRKIDEVKTFTRQAYKDLDARKVEKAAL